MTVDPKGQHTKLKNSQLFGDVPPLFVITQFKKFSVRVKSNNLLSNINFAPGAVLSFPSPFYTPLVRSKLWLDFEICHSGTKNCTLF